MYLGSGGVPSPEAGRGSPVDLRPLPREFMTSPPRST